MEDDYFQVRKFQVHLKNIETGQTDIVQFQLDMPKSSTSIKDASIFIEAIFKETHEIEEIIEIKSIVSIHVDPICPN